MPVLATKRPFQPILDATSTVPPHYRSTLGGRYQFNVLNRLQYFDVSTRNGISIKILEELVRISEDNDASLKEERLFLFFIKKFLR